MFRHRWLAEDASVLRCQVFLPRKGDALHQVDELVTHGDVYDQRLLGVVVDTLVATDQVASFDQLLGAVEDELSAVCTKHVEVPLVDVRASVDPGGEALPGELGVPLDIQAGQVVRDAHRHNLLLIVAEDAGEHGVAVDGRRTESKRQHKETPSTDGMRG